MNRALLKISLVKHETVGGRIPLKPYKDTAEKLTIGIGRNLDDVGIRMDEALLMLENDINAALSFCEHAITDFLTLSDARQNVLVEMAFNLGGPKLLLFKKMLAAVERRDFDEAAAQMLDSTWARQVGQRAVDLSNAMRVG